MRTTTCEKSVTAKVVLLRNDQQLSLKIDDVVLTKMFTGVISIDDNTLAEKLLFLELSHIALTLYLFQILTYKYVAFTR